MGGEPQAEMLDAMNQGNLRGSEQANEVEVVLAREACGRRGRTWLIIWQRCWVSHS